MLDYPGKISIIPNMTFTLRDATNLIYSERAVQAECEEWQFVAEKLYRALVVEKRHRGVKYCDAEMIAEALEAYEKLA